MAFANLYGTGFEDEAADVVATAISEILNRPPENVDNWQAYMVTIVHRRAIDFLRSAAVRRHDGREFDLSAHPAEEDSISEVEDGIDTLAQVKLAAAALNSMELRARDIAHAFFWEEKKQADIAREFGVSQPRVSQIIKDARSVLRTAIEGGTK